MIALVSIITLLAIPCFAILNGLVLSTLWAWFIVPLGVKSISIATAIGLMFVVGMFKQVEIIQPFKNATQAVIYLFFVITKPLILLLAGWIITFFL